MRTLVNGMLISVLWTAGVIPLCAQDAMRGHWTGSVELPNQTLAMELDLDKKSNGWIGSIAIPAQNATGIPLDAISFNAGKCSFRMKGAPGDPTFAGTISDDAKTMTGNLTQGPGSFPFKFTRAGDPKVDEAKASPALAARFLGSWEGTLEGPNLRLILKMSNDAAGAQALLISVDQGAAEIPVTTIEQKESKLILTVNMVGGKYDAEINKDGTELAGTWSQGGNDLPLKLKKSAPPSEKKP